jgi:beta-N-acetylhexosaminidase
VDVLLLPADLNGPDIITFYDDYIAGIAAKVESGEISPERIDESVKRILLLKAKYGILDVEGNGSTAEDIETRVAKCKEIVGSEAHHEVEASIARSAITLLKNDNNTIPVASDKKKIVILGRLEDDKNTLSYAVDEMKKQGLIAADADVAIDYYYNSSGDDKLHYPDELKEKLAAADLTIGFSYASGSTVIDKENAQFIALHNAIDDVHTGGGRFILVSENLPYDAAVYQNADAIVLAYMGSGLNIDPTDRGNGIGSSAMNANIVAAVETVFGSNSPSGKLPVNIPVVEEGADGKLSFGKDFIYERGFGLN